MIRWCVRPWVTEDRFKRKQIFTDIKEPPIKEARHNGVVVSCILMRVSGKGGWQSKDFFLCISRYFTAGKSVQGCVHD